MCPFQTPQAWAIRHQPGVCSMCPVMGLAASRKQITNYDKRAPRKCLHWPSLLVSAGPADIAICAARIQPDRRRNFSRHVEFFVRSLARGMSRTFWASTSLLAASGGFGCRHERNQSLCPQGLGPCSAHPCVARKTLFVQMRLAQLCTKNVGTLRATAVVGPF